MAPLADRRYKKPIRGGRSIKGLSRWFTPRRHSRCRSSPGMDITKVRGKIARRAITRPCWIRQRARSGDFQLADLYTAVRNRRSLIEPAPLRRGQIPKCLLQHLEFVPIDV